MNWKKDPNQLCVTYPLVGYFVKILTRKVWALFLAEKSASTKREISKFLVARFNVCFVQCSLNSELQSWIKIHINLNQTTGWAFLCVIPNVLETRDFSVWTRTPSMMGHHQLKNPQPRGGNKWLGLCGQIKTMVFFAQKFQDHRKRDLHVTTWTFLRMVLANVSL